MKLRPAPLLLALTLSSPACIGSFSLTHKVLEFNKGLGSLVVQEVVFLALLIVPVYEITLFADAIVLNTIEALTGDNPIAKGPGETRLAGLPDGGTVAVTPLDDGSLEVAVERPGRRAEVRRLRREGRRAVLEADGVAVAEIQATEDGGARVIDASGERVVDAATLARLAQARAEGGTEALLREVEQLSR